MARIPLDFRGALLLHKPFAIQELKEVVCSLPRARGLSAPVPSPAQPGLPLPDEGGDALPSGAS
jgi:hypothetical protein